MLIESIIRLRLVFRHAAINFLRLIVPFEILRRVFPKKMTGRGRRFSHEEKVDHYVGIFLKLQSALEPQGFVIKGSDVVEIGPGDNFLLALCFLAFGARSALLVDRFKFASHEKHFEECLLLLDRLAEQYAVPRVDAQELLSRVSYVAPSLIDGRDTASHDLIYSHAVLEHIADLPTSFSTWHALLRPGGIMVHDVDFRSHGVFVSNELDFMTFSRLTWWLMSSNRGLINRIRWDEHKEMLHRWFSLVDFSSEMYPEDVVLDFLRMYPQYQSRYQDLRVARVRYVCVKREAPEGLSKSEFGSDEGPLCLLNSS